MGATLLTALTALLGISPAAAEDRTPAQWGVAITGARSAHGRGLTGAGIDIAVVDTGVNLAHQEFAGRITAGYDFVDDDATAQDEDAAVGHGTHVAGIAAAADDGNGTVGVAPQARIMPVRVLDDDGSGSSDDVEAGIRWAVDNGAEVINLSLGADTDFVFGPGFADAIVDAWAQGVICVVAAGNRFVLPSGFDDEPAMVVSATTRQDGEAYFSDDVGSAMWGIAAPGGAASPTSPIEDDILSTDGRPAEGNASYHYLAGTSMAAPHVAGAAALLRQAGLSPQQTVDTLLATARDLGVGGRDGTYGAGRLDVAAAAAAALGAPVVPTPAPAPDPATATPSTPSEPSEPDRGAGGAGDASDAPPSPTDATATVEAAPGAAAAEQGASADRLGSTAGPADGRIVVNEPEGGSGRAVPGAVAAVSAAAAWAWLIIGRRRIGDGAAAG